MLQKYIFFTFLFLGFVVNGYSQIISNEKSRTASEEKVSTTKKSPIELYVGVSPSYTHRVLKVNEGLFASQLGIREQEVAQWTVGYMAGIRKPLGEHFRLEIGAGFFSNKEHFNYEEADSVFRYTNSYRSIGMPIRVGYSHGDKVSFYGALGFMPKAFLSMKREETIKTTESNKEVTTEWREIDPYNLFLVDAIANAGVRVKFNQNIGMYALLEARYQITNNYTDQQPYIRHPYALGLNIGLEFYL